MHWTWPEFESLPTYVHQVLVEQLEKDSTDGSYRDISR